MKVKVHPLFFVALLLYALFGNVNGYLLAFASVTAHELAHYLVAMICGARDLTVLLLPCGAALSVKGEFSHYAVVLAAGPFFSLVLASFALSACWIVPELYGAFKTFITANAFLAALNLLPAYPLDGGRLFRLLFPQKWARVTSDALTLLLGGAALFCFFLFFKLSYLIFALFMILSFTATKVGRVNRLTENDPLYLLARTDEDGRLRPALVKRGKRRALRLSAKKIPPLLLTFPPDTPLRKALERYK